MKLNGGVPGMSLGLSFQRDLLYTATNHPKKAWRYVLHRFLYQGNVWLMIWGMAHATLQTHVVTRFISQHSDIGMEHTNMEAQAETTLWEGKWQPHNQDQKP